MKTPVKFIKVKETTLNEIARIIAAHLGNLPLHTQRAANYSLLPKDVGREVCPVCYLLKTDTIELKASHHRRPEGLEPNDDLIECKACDTFFVSNGKGWQLAQPFIP